MLLKNLVLLLPRGGLMRRLLVGRLVASWMGASGGLWACGCAGAGVGVAAGLASNAALSCASCLLRAANSSWLDLERLEVLLDPLIVSTGVGTVGSGDSWCWCAGVAASAALLASA